jgi:hypothetical protein
MMTMSRGVGIIPAMPSALEDLVGNMTLAELAARSGKSVEAIAAYALGGASGSNGARARAATSSPEPSAKTGRRKAVAETRTRTGRDDFDTRVLDAIKNAGGTAQSVDIEKIVGGTAQQRRAALHRLIASRKLARTGKARSTTYTVR